MNNINILYTPRDTRSLTRIKTGLKHETVNLRNIYLLYFSFFCPLPPNPFYSSITSNTFHSECTIFLFLNYLHSERCYTLYRTCPCCGTKGIAQMTGMRRLSELSKLITLGNYNSGPEALLMYRFCRDFLSRSFELPRFHANPIHRACTRLTAASVPRVGLRFPE